jgi:AraC-like DNA-binding protein
MLEYRHELLSLFTPPVYTPHPVFPQVQTFRAVRNWQGECGIELPGVHLIIHSIDFLECGPERGFSQINEVLRFHQNAFRLWYQIDGTGILQNVSRKMFGTARPGLLGIMDRGERFTYLHQRGTFSCFQLLFSLFPSSRGSWTMNAEIEGKTILTGDSRRQYEQSVFQFFRMLSEGSPDLPGLASLSSLLDIIRVVFEKGLIVLNSGNMPNDKSKSLIARAKKTMDTRYAEIRRQPEIARECGVDVNYLNLLFRRETGKTLYDYYTGIRMEHAKHLLETTSKPASEIAAMTGYRNANTFYRTFRRQEGIPPAEYRMRSIKCGLPRDTKLKSPPTQS